MKIEDIENASDADLRQKLVDTFAQAESLDQLAGTILLRKARFFQDEIERRQNHKVSRRDFRMELIVILLIGLELVVAVGLAVWGEQQQSADVNQELVAFGQIKDELSHLQKSTQATASSLEQELDLEYALAINVEYNGVDSVQVFNNSRTQASLAGIKVGGTAATIRNGRPTVIADHNMIAINLAEYDPKLQDKIRNSSGKPFPIPIEIQLTNAQSKEFVWRGQLTYGRPSGNLEGSPAGMLVAEPN